MLVVPVMPIQVKNRPQILRSSKIVGQAMVLTAEHPTRGEPPSYQQQQGASGPLASDPGFSSQTQQQQHQQPHASGFMPAVTDLEGSHPAWVARRPAPNRASPRKRKLPTSTPPTPAPPHSALPTSAPRSVLQAADIFHVGQHGDAPTATVNPPDPAQRQLPTPAGLQSKQGKGRQAEGDRGAHPADMQSSGMQDAQRARSIPGSNLGSSALTGWGQVAQQMGQMVQQTPAFLRNPPPLQAARLPPVPPPPKADHKGGMSLGDMGLRSSLRSIPSNQLEAAQTSLAQPHPLARTQPHAPPPNVGAAALQPPSAGVLQLPTAAAPHLLARSGSRSLPSMGGTDVRSPFRTAARLPSTGRSASHSLPNMDTAMAAAGLQSFAQGGVGLYGNPPTLRPLTPQGGGRLAPLSRSVSFPTLSSSRNTMLSPTRMVGSYPLPTSGSLSNPATSALLPGRASGTDLFAPSRLLSSIPTAASDLQTALEQRYRQDPHQDPHQDPAMSSRMGVGTQPYAAGPGSLFTRLGSNPSSATAFPGMQSQPGNVGGDLSAVAGRVSRDTRQASASTQHRQQQQQQPLPGIPTGDPGQTPTHARQALFSNQQQQQQQQQQQAQLGTGLQDLTQWFQSGASAQRVNEGAQTGAFRQWIGSQGAGQAAPHSKPPDP
ncbi:hypothetical protein WJX74_004853 [Apatococcus lobatus]|uniref:Uncharacterized protein n=1 Tax=Apatococcus lobatus TaxID=904363 RepID=A0AAW1RS81_9CHLO